MKTRIIMVIAFIMAMANNIIAGDRLFVENFSVTGGETKEISVLLENETPFVAFQFDIVFPRGVSLVGYEVDANRIPASTEVSEARISSYYRFFAAAMSMEPIVGNDGAILRLKLQVDGNIKNDEKQCYLRNVKLSKMDGTGVTISEVPFVVTIIEQPTVITAKSYPREYGDDNPTFEYEVDGADLVGTPEITCEATASSPVGKYPIVISKGSVTNNNDSYVNGTLEITKAPLTITAKSYSIMQSESLPKYEVTYSGFKNGETDDVLKTKAQVSCSAIYGVPGTYDIIVEGAEALNYEIQYISGTLTIKSETNTLTYLVDGEEYQSFSVKYGEVIIPINEPTKEGYTFSGWSEIPATMPAEDVVVTGSFTANPIALVAGLRYQYSTKDNTAIVIADDSYKELTSVTFPVKVIIGGKNYEVTGIGTRAFSGCSGLTSITCEASIPPTCGNNAFEDVNKSSCTLFVPAQSVEVYKAADQWKDFENLNGVIGFADANVKAICIANWDTNGDGKLSLSEAASVTSLGDVFKGNKNIVSFDELQYFTRLKSIDDFAFCECKGLTSIKIPNGVKTVGMYAFSYTGLTSIELPNRVTIIGEGAFLGCSHLTSIEIPNSVTTIGTGAFDNTAWFKNQPDGLVYTGKVAYKYKGSVPDDTIVINEGTTGIAQGAFSDCTSITSIICKATTPPICDYYIFYLPFDFSACILYVPKNSVSLYQAKAPWNSFNKILKIDMPKHTLTYILDGEIYKSFELEEGETIIPEKKPTKRGYTFSGWSVIPATMPAEDVIVEGTFSINSYKLTYLVDGEEYQSYTVVYGDAITPIDEPTKEGYTFSGWSNIPATMPARNVTVEGTFTLDTTGMDGIIADEEDGKTYFDMNGREIPTLQKGLNIVKYANGQTIKVVIK